ERRRALGITLRDARFARLTLADLRTRGLNRVQRVPQVVVVALARIDERLEEDRACDEREEPHDAGEHTCQLALAGVQLVEECQGCHVTCLPRWPRRSRIPPRSSPSSWRRPSCPRGI